MNADLDNSMEPLPGYRLIERLGTGGYGEVWRAEAPGGLTKAIKFVFGKHDEKRASHEMRALERIRSVRHPFLLSLERIEIVDGRLIVVMELADGSVKERFDQCRAQGLPGIPRDEMLCYLRDAADALDFMAQAHALQHLDIKPENMLLLAGHVKVGDFGLVKDVRQSQASLVGGLTPLYAAPEVFRGTPSARSDQYSLGVLYQEMLTGTLPFAGSSAAELTLQHLNDEPDMTALSHGDRYAVSRTLAKDPDHRYATCREFVDALSKSEAAHGATATVVAPSAPFVGSSQFAESLLPTPSQTDLFDDESTAWNADPEHRRIELPPPDASLVDLPAVDLKEHDCRQVPTLIVGIGGAAAKVLVQLRRMICERFGEPTALPSVQMLLVDTDAKALADASQCDRGLTPDETLHVPLRRPQHYREHSQQLLQWLSRRWLYNIPRSLRTEGLRPLGRLALADHARQLGQRIRRGVMQAMEPQAVERSKQAIGRDVRGDAARVYVVASVSGGSGGGMSLDMGYMVRAVLNKLGVAHSRITGIMLHATGEDPRVAELARVNAYSWLTEFYHFQQPENGYPGDPSCGLPSHEAGLGAFDATYLVHLGEQLDSYEFDQAAQSVAEYLRIRITTSAQPFFDACQSETDVTDAPNSVDCAKVRSFGLFRRMAAEGELCGGLAEQLARHVVDGWRAGSATDAGRTNDNCAASQPPHGADELAERLQLTSKAIATNSRSLIAPRLGERDDQFLTAWLRKHSEANVNALQQIQAIDRLFLDDATEPTDAAEAPCFLGDSLATIALPLAERIRNELRRWVCDQVNDPSARIAGARRAAGWLAAHFRSIERDLQRFTNIVDGKLREVRNAPAVAESAPMVRIGEGSAVQVSGRAVQYFRVRLDRLALSLAMHTICQALSDLKSVEDELDELVREMEHLTISVKRSENVKSFEAGAADSDTDSEPVAASCIAPRVDQLAVEVNQKLQSEFLREHGGLMKTVLGGGRTRAQLSAKLREFAGQAVSRTLAGMNVMQEVLRDDGQAESGLRSALASATPSLVQFGGTRRVLAVLPRDVADATSAETLSSALGSEVTIVAGDDNSLTLCVESGELSVLYAAVDFVQGRRDRVDFAERVHSRTDILWTPLLSASALSAPCPWGNDDEIQRSPSNDLSKTLVM